MRANILSLFFEKCFFGQLSIIETVIRKLKSICQIEHRGHQRSDNFLINPLANLPA
ncbi:TPA: hypothetical protein I8Z14_000619 [Legionella pneumophila]|nr:hypothetical protein [Legionella pneumophila]